MKNPIFKGFGTALVTPMTPHGVDYDALARLIDFQIEEGINALVAVGTTGESATLSQEERKEVIRFTVKRADGRVPVVAGVGTNNTEHVIDFTKSACDDGADGLLAVTPYYNKATQRGLIAHYTAVADVATKPLIVYNVPSRTGCNILPETDAVLADHERIVAVKEASGNISQIAKVAELCGDKMDIYSGNDDQIVPVLSLGGKGVISVLSNLVPKETSDMCHLFWEGKTKEALELQLKYLPLVDALFSEVNPIPAKAAMAAMGYCENALRLPLTTMERKNEENLFACMRKVGLLED